MKNIVALFVLTICILAFLAPENKVENHSKPEEISKIDTSDVRKLTEELDWKTYHNDSVDGMNIRSCFSRNDNDPIEIVEVKIERKVATEDQEDISIIVPPSINREKSIMMQFLNRDIVNNKDTATFDKDGPIVISLNEQKDHSSIAYIPTGRLKDANNIERNLLSKCSEFNHMMLVFEFQDGEQKSILIPLFNFKEKYEELE
ncbi:MAG: hypothetical protein ACKOX3_08375 [Bacteroidota bacterium]